MITRRDNLLVRPWQQRRFENHRKKVELALPAIDTRPPLPRQHVALKLKKQQKETERQQQIEKNNFSLLKRLSSAMRSSRVDNIWTTTQPNFLNRIAMYERTTIEPEFHDLMKENNFNAETITGRKAKCSACTPQAVIDTLVPEERVPWEPDKTTIARGRSRSVPVRKLETYEKTKTPKSAPKQIDNRTVSKSVLGRATQSITLSRGCLKLSVNFPPDTFVKMQEGLHEKTLLQNVCNCKNLNTRSMAASRN